MCPANDFASAAKLFDPTTGLLSYNVTAVCGSAGGGSFFCVVRAPRDGASEGVCVRYRRRCDGRSTVTWLGYRSR